MQTTIQTDLITPLAAYLALRDHARASFLLEPGAGDSGLRLELAAPPGREATVVRWIAGLVSVHGVERVCA